eukprot:m.415668 g.415668  ORF g.415668 m.415668 type:complete len:556 (-) comp56603_c0_seq1:144-1811(-)
MERMAQPRIASEVELRLHAQHLVRLDTLSKSDPCVIVLLKDPHTGHYVEKGRTEIIRNNQHPQFIKTITVPYTFETTQELRFRVVDVDEKDETLAHAQDIGTLNVTLAEVLRAPGGRLLGPLLDVFHPTTKRGDLAVTAHQVTAGGNQVAHFSIRGAHLDKKDTFGKSDPYFIIKKREEGVLDSLAWAKLYQSEIIKVTLEPAWKPFSLKLQTLCNGDEHLALHIECYDWDEHSAHDLIGVCVTTLAQIKTASANRSGLPLINEKKALSKKAYTNSGELFVNLTLETSHTFLDYLTGGCEMNTVIAVDFTGSNGDADDPTSLHHYKPGSGTFNQYQQVISSVVSILSYYDTDRLFPSFGFGGKPHGSSVVSHDFALNGNAANPYCAGVPGVLDAYASAITHVDLSGPTNFAPVILHAMAVAREARSRLSYLVLLIITDGEITDMFETKKAIIEASTLPMSLIIVGVGPALFGMMNQLDADKGPLSHAGKTAVRDIVQFVPFRDFVGRPEALAAAVLGEVPAQVVQYMKANKIDPPPRPDLPPAGAFATATTAPSH